MINPILLIASLLGAGDWKQRLKLGEDAAKQEARALLHAKLFDAKSGKKSKIQQIAAQMQSEGWTWDSTDARVTGVPDEGLGRGFLLSRDALYRIIKAIGTPGGALRDVWRDSDDNAIWLAIAPNCPPGTSLDSLVAQTAEEFINKTLGHAA